MAGVETDCCLACDGGIVLLHDDLLPTGTDLDGWAHDRTTAELLGGRLRSRTGEVTAETVLGLDEALTLLSGKAQVIQLEVKATADVALAERTAAALCARRDVRELSDRIEIISFWPPAVEVAARAGLRTRLIVAAAYAPDAFARWAGAAGVTGVILEGPYWAAEPVGMWRGCRPVGDVRSGQRPGGPGPGARVRARPHRHRPATRAVPAPASDVRGHGAFNRGGRCVTPSACCICTRRVRLFLHGRTTVP